MDSGARSRFWSVVGAVIVCLHVSACGEAAADVVGEDATGAADVRLSPLHAIRVSVYSPQPLYKLQQRTSLECDMVPWDGAASALAREARFHVGAAFAGRAPFDQP